MTERQSLHRFARPAVARRLAVGLLPWTAGAAAILLTIGLGLALIVSPPDYQQGESVRIMYIHVPAAWTALMAYVGVALASAVALVWRHPVAHLFARASAPIGAIFTVLTLATGALWGKPSWGTWWVWDARLTSVLVLLFLYLGFIALQDAFDQPERGQRAAAILAVVGVINVPIIKFSVDWWNTLHQPASVFRFDGPTIHPTMLWPLLIMAAGYMALYLTATLMRLRAELARRRLAALAMAAG